MRNLTHRTVLASAVTIVAIALFAKSSPGETVTITEDFEGNMAALVWSTAITSTTPSGETFLGPFNAATISVIVPMPGDYFSASLSFDIYAIGDWPRGAPWLARQYVPSVDTMMLLTASYLNNHLSKTAVDTLGYDSDRTYHFRTHFTGTGEDYYRVDFIGQGGTSWGLDNVVVRVDRVVPEPSAFVLLGIGAIGFCFLTLRTLPQTKKEINHEPVKNQTPPPNN